MAPTQFEIHLQLGKILERQNHFAEGKKHFEIAVKLKPESAEARWALARSLAKLGLEGEAQKQYEEAIRLLEIQRKFASNGKTKD